VCQQGRHEHIEEGGDDQVEDLVVGSDATAVPQEQGRDIPDRRPGAPSITSDDAEAGILHSVSLVWYESAEDSDDDDGGSKVVEEGREEERGQGNTPQELSLIVRHYDLCYGLEAPIVIDGIDEHHRAEDEEERAGYVPEVMVELEG